MAVSLPHLVSPTRRPEAKVNLGGTPGVSNWSPSCLGNQVFKVRNGYFQICHPFIWFSGDKPREAVTRNFANTIATAEEGLGTVDEEMFRRLTLYQIRRVLFSKVTRTVT